MQNERLPNTKCWGKKGVHCWASYQGLSPQKHLGVWRDIYVIVSCSLNIYLLSAGRGLGRNPEQT